jgi:hypothetical protein
MSEIVYGEDCGDIIGLQATVDVNDLRPTFHPGLQMSPRMRRTLPQQDWPGTRLENAQ